MALGKQVKGIIFNNPHNPTGKIFKRTVILELMGLCERLVRDDCGRRTLVMGSSRRGFVSKLINLRMAGTTFTSLLMKCMPCRNSTEMNFAPFWKFIDRKYSSLNSYTSSGGLVRSAFISNVQIHPSQRTNDVENLLCWFRTFAYLVFEPESSIQEIQD